MTEPARRDQVEGAVKTLINNIPSYKGRCEYICTSALDNKPPYLVKQIEDIIERRIKSGAVNLDSLPNYSDSSDTPVNLPGCNKPIRVSRCVLL